MPDMWWEEATSGDAPANAIIVGNTASGEKLYVGRGYVEDALVCGEVHPSENGCYVGNNGAEFVLTTYEVLVSKDSDKFEWVSATDGTVPSGAVVGGKTSTGEEIYVARATPTNEPGGLRGGKLVPSHGCVYYALNGHEYSTAEYEVLCEKSSFCNIL